MLPYFKLQLQAHRSARGNPFLPDGLRIAYTCPDRHRSGSTGCRPAACRWGSNLAARPRPEWLTAGLPGIPVHRDHIEDDLLSICLGYEFCFGKALRLVGKFCTASDAKEEYIPRWQILKKQFDQFFNRSSPPFALWMKSLYI